MFVFFVDGCVYVLEYLSLLVCVIEFVRVSVCMSLSICLSESCECELGMCDLWHFWSTFSEP